MPITAGIVSRAIDAIRQNKHLRESFANVSKAHYELQTQVWDLEKEIEQYRKLLEDLGLTPTAIALILGSTDPERPSFES